MSGKFNRLEDRLAERRTTNDMDVDRARSTVIRAMHCGGDGQSEESESEGLLLGAVVGMDDGLDETKWKTVDW